MGQRAGRTLLSGRPIGPELSIGREPGRVRRVLLLLRTIRIGSWPCRNGRSIASALVVGTDESIVRSSSAVPWGQRAPREIILPKPQSQAGAHAVAQDLLSSGESKPNSGIASPILVSCMEIDAT
jgi:hypothetical protein